MKRTIGQFKYIIKKLKENNINEHAAACAYYTILSFIPIIMLILTLTKYIGVNEEILFGVFNGAIPSNILNNAIIGIVKEVYSKSIGTITISAIFILWSAGKGFFALCKGLNSAYEIKDENKFIWYRIRAIICTIVFILSVVLSLILLVFGNRINVVLQEKFHIFSDIINILLKSKILMSTVLLSIIFSIMYKFIPRHKCRIKFKYQILGAIIAASACNIISGFYAVYVNLFTGFSLMYGSLTTIVFAMIWVYWCMYLILFGAMINNIVAKNVEKRR